MISLGDFMLLSRIYKGRPLRDGPLLAQQYIKGDFLTLFAKK